MKDIRKLRLESQIQRELASLIHRRQVKDDRINFVSIVRIELESDLSQMVASVSLFGTEEENRLTFKALKDAAGFFQSSIGKNLRLRVTPRLVFQIDTSIAEGDRVLNLIENSRPPDPSPSHPSGSPEETPGA